MYASSLKLQYIANRFITVLFILGSRFETPDFVGAPYEFWVGGNVGIGTSVGQIRLNDALSKKQITYDLLHSYSEGGKGKYF